MVLPSSNNFFWPPERFPANSLDKCPRFKNSTTSFAFSLIIASSCATKPGLNYAVIIFSPDWFPGTIIKFSKTDKFENSCAIWNVLNNPLENNS